MSLNKWEECRWCKQPYNRGDANSPHPYCSRKCASQDPGAELQFEMVSAQAVSNIIWEREFRVIYNFKSIFMGEHFFTKYVGTKRFDLDSVLWKVFTESEGNIKAYLQKQLFLRRIILPFLLKKWVFYAEARIARYEIYDNEFNKKENSHWPNRRIEMAGMIEEIKNM